MTDTTAFKTARVFVPGGLPELTYVSRDELELEARLQESAQDFHKLVAVTGSTKSGKTVLASKVFPRLASVWVDGGVAQEEDDFWSIVLEAVGGFTDYTDEEDSASETQLEIGGEISGNAIVAKGKVDVRRGTKSSSSARLSKGRSVSPRAAAISALRAAELPLVIDDFHYLDRDLQGSVVRALKPLVFDGLACTLIAIPHRRYDAIKVEREITGRLETVSIPSWSKGELLEIANAGFPLLNMHVSEPVRLRLAEEAYGSPHLMQEFCQELAFAHGVKETAATEVVVDTVDDELFQKVAGGTGKAMFDRLARGPRQRTDRIQRPLKEGGTADIYQVVLKALSRIGPGLDTIEYETVRTAIRHVLADAVPQAHEVTRVLEKMAEIAMSDESSTPVLDWEKDEQVLHITDPFFAFFLKWGVE